MDEKDIEKRAAKGQYTVPIHQFNYLHLIFLSTEAEKAIEAAKKGVSADDNKAASDEQEEEEDNSPDDHNKVT